MNTNLSALFANAPGNYTFPAAWTEAQDAVSMLSSERTGATRLRDEAHVRWQGAERERAGEMLAAARAGKLPDDVAEPVLDAKAADDRLTIAATVLGIAQKFAEDDLARIVAAEADAFIQSHLQPALAEVVGTARATAPTLAGLDLTDPATLSRASEPVRTAYDATLAAAERLFAIRQGQQALGRLRGGGTLTLDQEIANIGTIWPGWAKLRFNGVPAKAPWGPDRVAALVWLIGHDAELWVPTPEQVAEVRRDRAASPGVRAIREHDRRVLTGR